ncbi:hypothetical protein FRC17_009812 [Serendipita sp. 399]|nr:hypothetical protein FRC17_009812 [Serendipita sp. 399]
MSALDDDYESYPAHTRIPEHEILAVYAELTMNGEYDLLPYEQEWRERGPLIHHWGYQLRRRYDMDWIPSWENTDINPFFCEDSIDSSIPNVMDAIRIDDGLPVAIKATLTWTNEAPIAFLFTDGGAIEEPRNHCVPVLDTFVEDDLVYIVMPLLRAFNDPPFVAVAEVVDFKQGIEYMHEQNVAHRDITVGNIMMDASELYPDGFHPVRQNLSRNGLAEVVGLMRMHAPVRYYLIDFGSAIAFEKGTPSRDKYAEGRTGRDEDVPEFRFNAPYDPFKVDIFQFGNLLSKEFLQRYTGVEFLEPLVREMTRPRPSERPNAKALRLRFNTVQNRLSQSQLRAHLNLKDATDPFRQRLLELGIESLLDSDPDDSPEHSSSEAPTTGNSTRSSHDSYWSGAQSMDSSVTSQSSVDHTPAQGPLATITSMFTRARSGSRSTAQPAEPKQGNIPWKPAKLAKPRSPSPPPIQTAPLPIPSAYEPDDLTRHGRSTSPKGRMRTGKFPWSRDDSPDSIGHSPILAVVNQFLQPDKSTLTDTFESAFYRPTASANDHYGWDPSFTGTQYNTVSPTTAVPTTKANPPSAPGRNRRNTVNTPSAPAPAPPSTAKPTIASASRNGWGAMDSIQADPDSFGDFLYNTGPSIKTSNYGANNKSTSTLPPNSSKYATWTSPNNYDDPFMELAQNPEPTQAELGFWASEDAIRAMNHAPPTKPSSTKPVEPKPMESRPIEKETIPEKKAKGVKSFASAISKKSTPAAPEPTPSVSPPPPPATIRPGITPARPGLANLANRKSTIAVEDATPFNTPPKTTVRLPSPPPASPPPTKTKKTKSKKGSISETTKELERLEKEKQEKERLEAEKREQERLELERIEREEQERLEKQREEERLARERAEQEERDRQLQQNEEFYGIDDEFAAPGSFGSFSTSKGRHRRGSSPNGTDRATSPYTMFSGARTGASTKKEPVPKTKPVAPKPTSSKPSTFAWGARPKISPPIDINEPSVDVSSKPGAVPWGSKPKNSPPAYNEPATDGFSFATSFLSSGWKTKNEETALVPHSNTLSPQSETTPSTTSSPVTTPPTKSGWKVKTSYFPEVKATASSPKDEEDDLAHLKAQMEATPKASLAFGDSLSAFSFGGGFTAPDPVTGPENGFSFSKKTTKTNVEAAPVAEPQETKVLKGKNKKTGKAATKSSFSAEPVTPAAVVEEEDPWTKPINKAPAQAPSKSTSGFQFGDWFGTAGANDQEDDFYEQAQPTEPQGGSQEASWFFSPTAVANTFVKATTDFINGKDGKASEVPEEVAPEETNGEEDEWYQPVKGKGAKGKKVKETEVKAALAPTPAPTKDNKWASITTKEEEEEPKESKDGGDDLAADLAAALDGDDSAKVADPPTEPAEKEAAKNVKANNAKQPAKKKKNKR